MALICGSTGNHPRDVGIDYKRCTCVACCIHRATCRFWIRVSQARLRLEIKRLNQQIRRIKEWAE